MSRLLPAQRRFSKSPFLVVAYHAVVAVSFLMLCSTVFLQHRQQAYWMESIVGETSCEGDLCAVQPTQLSSSSQPVSAATIEVALAEEEEYPVTFVPPQYLKNEDAFSAAWWQSVERFLKIPFSADKYGTVEDNCFAAIVRSNNGLQDARMSEDWLDWSVEHQSKWWKLLRTNEGLAYATARFQAYEHKMMSRAVMGSNSNQALNHLHQTQRDLFTTTLAIVPLGVKGTEEARVWGAALRATLSALISRGAVRIVLVGHYPTDRMIAYDAFAKLSPYFPSNDRSTDGSVRIDRSDLIYIHTDDVTTKFIPKNIPFGALRGLVQAINGTHPNSTTWLGPKFHNNVRNIYMTEADQMLHSRLSLDTAQPLLNEGRILVPHRLQPLPHPYDLQGIVRNETLLPLPTFTAVQTLSLHSGACCDIHRNWIQETADKKCTIGYWWSCGFHLPTYNETHARLESYDLIRFNDGVGTVLLSANEQGRRCRPATRGQCLPGIVETV